MRRGQRTERQRDAAALGGQRDLLRGTGSRSILFLRVYVEMYPEAEAALIARIAEGRFDIGGSRARIVQARLNRFRRQRPDA